MSDREPFDVVQSPLQGGRTLIEASAGTGKTYTIAGIVLRLILEQDLAVEEILVTTYTELATAELRDRIRRLLREALLAFEVGTSSNELVAQLLERQSAKPEAKDRLRRALQAFDEAPVYTIHGFCQRMLKDRAFESGALFDAELVVDQSPILREIVEDFWRCQFYAGDPLTALAAIQHGITPDTLLRDLDDLVNRPTLQVISPLASSLAAAQEEVLANWAAARSCWQEKAVQVRAIFADASWAKQPYNLIEGVTAQFAELDRIWLLSSDSAGQTGSIKFFAASAIATGTRAHRHPPSHELFECCERLVTAEKKFVLCLRAHFLAWARTEMKRRKVQRNIVSFDDLLTRLNHSLGETEGPVLAQNIRQRFRAALIDEFQDTDPIQYSIFERIYAGSDAIVFFIGDPKQAIYGFRGADVFTYLEAAQAATRRYTLPTNWRSEKAMVEATNALFGLREDAFVLEGISFQRAEAAIRRDPEPLTLDGAEAPALQLWLASSDIAITNQEADRLLPEMVAGEIARLLNSETKIGRRRVAPPDIAVLVSTNDEAQLVQDALIIRDVPAVIYSAANVFQSREAQELAVILAAVVDPGHEQRLRAALATEAFGLTGEALDGLNRDERAWEKLALQFQRYHTLWQEEGFIQMLRAILVEQAIRPRLLTYPDGERRLTNMLHLAELLHRMCVESRLGMTGLVKRLSETIANSRSFQSEEYEVRLERDEDSVRIVTVHKSKGLEYGIVFCPFSWNNPRIARDSNVIVHQDGGVVLDLEKSESNQTLQLKEKLADKVRLLYVALTRAKQRAYLVWGNFRYGQESAPAHLLGKWANCGMAAIAAKTTIARVELPDPGKEVYRSQKVGDPELQARSFTRKLDRSFGIASFTRLIAGQGKEAEAPEFDVVEAAEGELAAVEMNEPPQTGMFAFPRGTGPGTCLHYIFEELDFGDRSQLPELVRGKLHAFSITGFDEVVCAMVEKVVAMPLGLDHSRFTLADVSLARRLTELEFYFPIEDVRCECLAELLGDDRLRFQPMSGFMKGFIDLIFEHQGKFYIVDWKSNWLGPNLESYSQAAMAFEMSRKFYNLQSSIYTVALHRFLRARLSGYEYDRHFGGVYYFFLRGVEPSRPEFGVFRTRLEAIVVEGLSVLLGHDH